MHNKNIIVNKVSSLVKAYKEGKLGGETMPEDSKPYLERNSEENLRYLTFPMALNYQRNSYKLWESALNTWNDSATQFVFEPLHVYNSTFEQLQQALTKYKVALQPNKQPQIWYKINQTVLNKYEGKVLNLLQDCDFDIQKILSKIQALEKGDFPYLSGNKIANYWLYVLTQYTDLPFTNKSFLSIAPDTQISNKPSNIVIGHYFFYSRVVSNCVEFISTR